MYEICAVEDLGNFTLEGKPVIWKGKTYTFPTYYIKDCSDYVMLDGYANEICTISCASGLVVVYEDEEGYEIMEVIK